MSKQDHLRLCNEHGLPFQDFVAGWCSRCFQPECTRSLHGKSRFEDRVLNWQDRLFNHVPRLDTSDPRYIELSSKKFLAVVPENYGQWADPRDLDQAPQRAAVVPVIPADPVPEPPPAPSIPAPPIPPLEPVLPKPAPPLQQPVLTNTSAKPKQMIGGHEPKPPQPVLDPWQPVQPLKPGDTLVKPGARIKLGQ